MEGVFGDKAKEAIAIAQSSLSSFNHTEMDAPHLLYGLLEDQEGVVSNILREMGIDPNLIRNEVVDVLNRIPKVYGASGVGYITPTAQRVLDNAWNEARRFGDKFIGTEHIFLALSKVGKDAGEIFKRYNITKERIYAALRKIRGTQRIEEPDAESKYGILKKFAVDLTEKAKNGELDPVIGRENEINRIMQILIRKTKNNPVLVGEAGVGKTAIVEGLAQRIIKNDVSMLLKDKRILELDIAGLVAGTKFRGEFEDRLKSILKEIDKESGQIIVFIDELHTIVGAGAAEGAVDAANIMKPFLARGRIQTIGATTIEEYRKYIEKDRALERRFQPVWVEEPSVEDTIKILQGLKKNYEKHHNIKITDNAIKEAVLLSKRYITDRYLPDKAIDLMDEACAQLRLKLSNIPEDIQNLEKRIQELTEKGKNLIKENKEDEANKIKDETEALKSEYQKKKEIWIKENNLSDTLKEEDIAKIVSEWTGVPVAKMIEGEQEKLVHLEDKIHQRIVDQEEAVISVANAIRRARAGIKDPKRPIGSFIFLGPTGVGKTEMAKALAFILFDKEDAMVRIDMSEYMEKHTVSRLIGAPPGYVGYEEGGYLTEAVRKRPYRVILFDEIEKAHPDVFNILLQVLDDGRLTDGQGRTVDFRNTIIIMTSNIASETIQNISDNYEKMKETVWEELRRRFKPEFINRVDEVIIFRPLTLEHTVKIFDILWDEMRKRLEEKHIYVDVDTPVKEFIAQKGFDPQYGARPLKRAIQKWIETPLSMKIVSGEVKEGDKINVILRDGKIEFEK